MKPYSRSIEKDFKNSMRTLKIEMEKKKALRKLILPLIKHIKNARYYISVYSTQDFLNIYPISGRKYDPVASDIQHKEIFGTMVSLAKKYNARDKLEQILDGEKSNIVLRIPNFRRLNNYERELVVTFRNAVKSHCEIEYYEKTITLSRIKEGSCEQAPQKMILVEK